ncbi:MAG TPA: hypothetical protein VKG26_05225 [Bacteroidia bacterium]|nr:hypothetical protein [Bacteroidia bacterium]
MSAIGELIIYFIYFILGLTCLIFFISTLLLSKKRAKIWTGLATLVFGFLLFSFKSCQSSHYKKNQLEHVGLYYLTSYPNCDSCIIELKENQTYQVSKRGQIIEQSNWHYEVGGDYWIVYLDNDNYQLGCGKFAYQVYKLKYGGKAIW